MPGPERHSLWDSTCLRHTAQARVPHMVEMAKTPEVTYVGYTCFPASNQGRVDVRQMQHRLRKTLPEGGMKAQLIFE